MSDNDNIISKFLQDTQPKDRICLFCKDNFKGFKEWCDKESCRKTGVAYLEYKRSLARDLWRRPLDYVSSARKTFFVEIIPGNEDSKNLPQNTSENEDIKLGETVLEEFRNKIKDTNK